MRSRAEGGRERLCLIVALRCLGCSDGRLGRTPPPYTQCMLPTMRSGRGGGCGASRQSSHRMMTHDLSLLYNNQNTAMVDDKSLHGKKKKKERKNAPREEPEIRREIAEGRLGIKSDISAGFAHERRSYGPALSVGGDRGRCLHSLINHGFLAHPVQSLLTCRSSGSIFNIVNHCLLISYFALCVGSVID